MASEEDPTVYGEDDLEEDDDDESEEEDLILPPTSNPRREDLDDYDVGDDDDDDTSSSNPATSAGKITVSIAGVRKSDPANSTQAGRGTVSDFLPDLKRHRIEDVTIALAVQEKKPLAALDESRRLFQRLWTDEDEIELLQGFLDYTTQRGGNNNSSHHHDTTAFYDQIKCKLQLDFNKNQLVEKLRRLKKKYRNVLSRIVSGKQYAFKSPHDKSTFEISNKIWSVSTVNGGAGGGEEAGLDDDDPNPNPGPSPNPNLNLNLNSIDLNNNGINPNSSEKKGSQSRKRSRVKIEEKHQFNQQPNQTATPIPIPIPSPTPMATSIPNLIEETVRSCVSPLFKELLNNSMNGGPCFSRGFGGIAGLNPIPFALNFTGGDMIDEKWRKQQILELEVYSKRLELVQDQIKSSLEELRSMGS
ncbi:hypothetical protein U1Q18_015296 [Sarracenia purpurea var. burkii]